MSNKHYTIKEIAKMAGVSAGTVDRVMHNRGEVSEASRVKVQKILDEIDYQPNMFAIGLAAKKKYSISCIIPSYIKDDYWHSVAQGIERAAKELHPFNVKVDLLHYYHSSADSYRYVQEEVLKKVPDAVLIAPNFQAETSGFAAQLHEADIPFAFVDANVEGVNAVKYIGQNSHQSGYIAAKLLTGEYRADNEFALFLTNYKDNPAEFQLQRRLKGFMKYLNENNIHPVIHEVVLNPLDYEESKKTLDCFFAQHPETAFGIVFNSRIYQVGTYLKETGRQLEALIGYDLLPRNVSLLKDGIITYLIGQRPELQGYCGIKALSDKVVFKKEIDPVKYMPIDILTKENIAYYFEFI